MQLVAVHGPKLRHAVLASMPYADAVVKEVLRFSPPATGIFRKTLVDMQVGMDSTQARLVLMVRLVLMIRLAHIQPLSVCCVMCVEGAAHQPGACLLAAANTAVLLPCLERAFCNGDAEASCLQLRKHYALPARCALCNSAAWSGHASERLHVHLSVYV